MPANRDMAHRDEDLDRRFRTLLPWLRAMLARRHGLSPADAEDVAQESFIRFNRYDVDDRARHPRALLLRIAANLTHDARRQGRARLVDRHVSFDALTSSPVNLVHPADQTTLIDLKATILDLPEPLRKTFLLARFTPLTNAEIARRLGVSTKTVEWRISKAVAICLVRLGR